MRDPGEDDDDHTAAARLPNPPLLQTNIAPFASQFPSTHVLVSSAPPFLGRAQTRVLTSPRLVCIVHAVWPQCVCVFNTRFLRSQAGAEAKSPPQVLSFATRWLPSAEFPPDFDFVARCEPDIRRKPTARSRHMSLSATRAPAPPQPARTRHAAACSRGAACSLPTPVSRP